MKKCLFILLLLIGSITTNAQTYYYKTFQFAYKQVNSYGNWSNWTDWEDSNLYVTIDFDSDVVKIYSSDTQVYRITQYVKKYTDEYGGKQTEFRFIDQDGDRGTMRLRIEKSGTSQIYIQFADVMWVYNIRKV